jgi:hypothetical protein
MYDCMPCLDNINIERKLKVDTIRQFTIVHRCCCCGKEIETFWNESHKLDGEWIALGVHFSQVFNAYVAWPDRILCNWCYGTGEWKKKGIRWK